MKKTLQTEFEYFETPEELSADDQILFDRAKGAWKTAYAPYSQFHVGCALRLKNGEIVTASNQENAAFPSGLCAERAAIFWAAANFPDEQMDTLFVVGGPKNEPGSSVPTPPCGACRQSILEYEERQKSGIRILFSSLHGKIYLLNSVADLLPFSFDASYL